MISAVKPTGQSLSMQNIMASTKRLSLSALIALQLSISAAAAGPFEDGCKQYQARQYQLALSSFARQQPQTAESCYYQGLCHHALGNYKNAKDFYRQVTLSFPNSVASKLAQQALSNAASAGTTRAVNQNTDTRTRDLSSTSASGQNYNDPAEIRVPFTLHDRDIMIDCYINNRKLSMCLDTGAPDCWIGTNHLQEIGISPPTGAYKMMQSQLGDDTNHKYWTSNYDFKMELINRPKFEFLVQENREGPALIGQTFLKAFQYTIDYGAKQIHFKPLAQIRTANRAAPSTVAVPFKRGDSYMELQATINGKPCKVLFDTGAPDVVMTSADCKKYGITVEGYGSNKTAVASRIVMGPIDKRDVPISVLDSENMSDPLLGQSFYKEWQYTIDDQRQVMHFLRR